jgi:signal transduction histidine kinase
MGVRVPAKVVREYALFFFDQQAREIYDDETGFIEATALAIGSLLERKLLTDQLRASQKMTMLGHLSSYLSHELNHGLSPLNYSIQNLNIDLDRLSAAAGHPDRLEQELAFTQDHLRDLGKSVVDMTETIRAFRDLLSVGKKQIFNLDELVQETLTLLRQTSMVSRVALVFQAGESLMAIRSQMPLLQHVLLNLVMNAIEQIQEARGQQGGQVRIRVEQVDRAEGRPVVRVLVEDSGPGVHWRLWEKIFEAGFTTRPDGSGLGLYISRNIVESLGGRLYVAESYINSGTVFAVDLPDQI